MSMNSITLLSGVTATNSPPTAATDGAETNDLKGRGNNVPDAATVIVQSTAGSGTMTVTVRMWGYSNITSTWIPLGPHATAASRGVLNLGNAIDEVQADTLSHAEPLLYPGHFDRLYAEVTAIGGTATAVDCFVVAEVKID